MNNQQAFAHIAQSVADTRAAMHDDELLQSARRKLGELTNMVTLTSMEAYHLRRWHLEMMQEIAALKAELATYDAAYPWGNDDD